MKWTEINRVRLHPISTFWHSPLSHAHFRTTLITQFCHTLPIHFVFVFVYCVACMRVDEAKLRVCARCKVSFRKFPGRPRQLEVLLLRSRPLLAAQDVVYM